MAGRSTAQSVPKEAKAAPEPCPLSPRDVAILRGETSHSEKTIRKWARGERVQASIDTSLKRACARKGIEARKESTS